MFAIILLYILYTQKKKERQTFRPRMGCHFKI